MSYIGSTPTTQSFIAGTDYFNGTGAAVSFTMSRAVNSVNDIEVIVNNVEQIPSGYSVSGTTLTFSVAPSSGTSNVYVRYLSTTNLSLAIPSGTSATFNTVTVADGSATTPSITNDGDTNTGIFFPAADTIAFAEGGVEAARFDSAGNMGLGATPNAWGASWKSASINTVGALASTTGVTRLYHNAYNNDTNNIYRTTAAASMYSQDGSHSWFTAASGTAGNVITFTQAMTLDANGVLLVGRTVTPSTAGVRAALSSTGDTALQITKEGVVAARLMTVSTALAFGVDGADGATERARIDTSGNLMVGRTTAGTSNAGGFSVFSTGLVSSERNGTVFLANRFGSDGTAIELRKQDATVGSISVTASATAYNTSSDYRLKNTIAPMTGALAKVALLKPVTYKWNLDGSDGQGFIAHELQEVVEGCVTGEKDAVDADGKPVHQGIDTSFLVATLTAAIQEQQALITALTTRITALENNNATQ